MGCFFSREREPRYRCRQCHTNNVDSIFERLCETCSVAARRARAVPNDGTEKPCFGEYRCGACSRTWTSRLCWPRNYQACRRCRQPVYPFNWRDLTPADAVYTTSQEHQREYCQKCQEVGYYCGNYARLHEKLQRDCETKSDQEKVDSFPSDAQIWGMLGTIALISAVWIGFLLLKLKPGFRRRLPPEMLPSDMLPPDTVHNRKKPRAMTSRRSGRSQDTLKTN